jgi:hypothetical protein
MDAGAAEWSLCKGLSKTAGDFRDWGIRINFHIQHNLMAEQEIIKHTKAIFEVSNDKGRKWQHRVKEVLSEILIIVFAVSISIWFHNWAESWKDRSDEKEFLTGLKQDLQADLVEMESDRASYVRGLQGVDYFAGVGSGGPLRLDSMSQYTILIFGNTQISPRISRFEALKSSGRLDIIRNRKLLIDIADLYQKDFPLIKIVNAYYNDLRANFLLPFVESHLQLDSAGNGVNWAAVLRSSPMRMMISRERDMSNCVADYSTAIEKAKGIIREIDNELR